LFSRICRNDNGDRSGVFIRQNDSRKRVGSGDGIRRQLENGLMGNDQATDFLCKFMSDHLLKDWKNLADSDKLIKYSPEAAHKMLKKYRRFRDRIWELANDEDLFNVEVAEDRKNS
ncbi:hypothetical protein LCGC14_1976750, partial [marine sediment metagenome]